MFVLYAPFNNIYISRWVHITVRCDHSKHFNSLHSFQQIALLNTEAKFHHNYILLISQTRTMLRSSVANRIFKTAFWRGDIIKMVQFKIGNSFDIFTFITHAGKMYFIF